jgi:hypothetical protein
MPATSPNMYRSSGVHRYAAMRIVRAWNRIVEKFLRVSTKPEAVTHSDALLVPSRRTLQQMRRHYNNRHHTLS